MLQLKAGIHGDAGQSVSDPQPRQDPEALTGGFQSSWRVPVQLEAPSGATVVKTNKTANTKPERPGLLQLTTHWVLNVRGASWPTFDSASDSKGGVERLHLCAWAFRVHISYSDNKKQPRQVETNCAPLQGALVLTWTWTSSRLLPETFAPS